MSEMCERDRQGGDPTVYRRQRGGLGWLSLGLLAVSLAISASAVAAPIDWSGTADWVPFDQALPRARAENKPVCVVVYADWCPKCRSLAPSFKSGPLVDASKQVLMVLQNSDEKPGWLAQRFGELGNYVPRIFFLKPDGTLDVSLNSGHERYPYFYTPGKASLLAEQMTRAAQAAGPPPPPPPPQPSPVVAAPVAEPPEDHGPWVLFGLLVAVGVIVYAAGKNSPKGDSE